MLKRLPFTVKVDTNDDVAFGVLLTSKGIMFDIAFWSISLNRKEKP